MIQNPVPALSVPFRGVPLKRAVLRQPDGNGTPRDLFEVVAARSRMENGSSVADRPSGAGVHERNRYELSARPARLTRPGGAAIGRVENRSSSAHDPSRVGVYEGNRCETIVRPARLAHPVAKNQSALDTWLPVIAHDGHRILVQVGDSAPRDWKGSR